MGGTFFMVFEVARIERAKIHNCTVKQIPLIETFLCGGVAGIFYWAPYYPLDTIKSAM